MRTMHVLRALGPVDVKNVRRDAMLRWLATYPIVMALLFRWGAPALEGALQARTQVDLVRYYPLLVSFLLLAVPTFAGTIIGFLLLDQRDDETLTALRVTPLTLNSYLAYRIATPIVLSIVMVAVSIPLTGLVEVDTVSLLVAALGAAPLAPLSALFLAAFARNKVQGFALIKGAGVLVWVTVLAYFVDARWQLAFGIVPQYWPAKLFWVLEAGEAGAWLFLLIGGAYQLLLGYLLLRRFNAAIQR